MTSELTVPALEIRQGPHRLYQFAVDGKRLDSFAAVSRIHRDSEDVIAGYQRPEALSHVRAIRTYLESSAPLMPNALVIAFDSRVRFQALNGDHAASGLGDLVIPLDEESKPGFLVDGQQRSAALRESDVEEFPIPVVAFVTDDVAEQRAQFILVNATKPLPKGLIHELLPATEASLPEALVRKRYPATVLEALNHDPKSPLHRRIRTPTTPEGVIKDNSMLKMLENSISDGALYRYYDPRTGSGDTQKMVSTLTNFWSAVARTFPEAWAAPPRRSRLTHGVGIIGLGFIMDAITDRRMKGSAPISEDTYCADLQTLREVCAWTEGSWEFGLRDRRAWNDLQNIPRDINMLADYLLAEYRARTADSSGKAPIAA